MPEVYWFKNDVPLKLFDDTMVSTEFGEVIVVKKALEEQSGNYTCVARNKVGNASVSYLVEVLGTLVYFYCYYRDIEFFFFFFKHSVAIDHQFLFEVMLD